MKSQANESSDNEEIFEKIEPWNEIVACDVLLDEIEAILNQVLVFPSIHEAKAISLWIVHTHCLDAANVSPILHISSPEKQCGKSTLLEVLQALVNKPLPSSNISPAALFRSIEKWQPTLLIDEADTFMVENEELRGIINSGHTRKLAYTVRCVGKAYEPRRFCTWSAKAIAGIGHLADTIEDRAINILLRRKLPNELREKFRNIPGFGFHNLLRKCVRFREDNIFTLQNSNPYIPAVLSDRAGDNWTPLFAIAELASKEWQERAEKAAIYLSNSHQNLLSVGVELLQDIKNIFDAKNVVRFYTNELLSALHAEDEAPWSTYNRGKPLSARQLANKLKEFRIQSRNIRIPPFGKTLKGYCVEDFSEAFSRYLPVPCAQSAATSATTLQLALDMASRDVNKTSVADAQALQNSCVADKKTSQLFSHAVCSVVADRTPNTGEANA